MKKFILPLAISLFALQSPAQDTSAEPTVAPSADPQPAQEAPQAEAGLGQELSKASLMQGSIKPTAKYFIVLFSASWCPPCRAEAPKVVTLYKDKIAANPDVELILASCDREEEKAKEWSTKENMTFPILMESEWAKIPAIKKISPRGIPTGYLLDSKGDVIAKGLPVEVYGKIDSK